MFTSAWFRRRRRAERANREASEKGDSPQISASYRTALFVTMCSHLEKPIIWANRSGNRVFARVSSTQGSLAQSAHPTRALRTMSSNSWEPKVSDGYFLPAPFVEATLPYLGSEIVALLRGGLLLPGKHLNC